MMHRVRAGVVTVIFAGMTSARAFSQEAHRPPLLRGLDLYFPVPADNALTREKVALGRRLFFDTLLSRNGTLSCASCHDPARAFTDGRARSVGTDGRLTVRSAPTLVNRVYGESHFWDGRAKTLEEQVLGPIANPDELGSTVNEVQQRLRGDRSYQALFAGVFGREPDDSALANALASYIRTLLAGDSPFDRYVDRDTTALSPVEREGLSVFRGKGRCISCHIGPRLSDEQFHNTGIAWRTGVLTDSGRFVVTRDPRHVGVFKTPTLREVARTAPYMHNGSLATLADVVEFYDRGGHPNPHLDAEIRPLRLSEREKTALIEFLRALSGTVTEGWPRE